MERADRRVPASSNARKKKLKTAGPEAARRDTWPAPPPAASGHDTIPTPPPSPHDAVEDVEIPTLRGIDIESNG